MSVFRHTAPWRLRGLAGTALTVAAVLATANLGLVLELAPALLLVGLALAGWMPGEERLVRAMRRRRGVLRPRRTAVATPRRRSPDVVVPGRVGASTVALRGPPRALLV